MSIALVLGASGCGLVPSNRLDDCDKLNRSLVAENSALRNMEDRLRAENEALVRRSYDDAERVGRLNRRVQDLEREIVAYQRDYQRLEAAYLDFKSNLGSGGASAPSGAFEPLPAPVDP